MTVQPELPFAEDPRRSLVDTGEPQYDRSGLLREPDQPDTTELDPSVNDGLWLHRDLSAHQFRWGFVGRVIKGGERILDLGCGSTMPLAHVLNFGIGSNIPALYVGVDYGKFKRGTVGKRAPRVWEGKHRERFDATIREQMDDLLRDYPELFTVVTSFEVIEHLYPATSVIDYLDNARRALVPGGRMYLSTPIVDVKNGRKIRARNHVHEFGVSELQRIVEACGFRVVDLFGTFGNVPDMKRAVEERYGSESDILDVYERLRMFYSDSVLANFLAPAFPRSSRNQFLVLEKGA